MLISRSWCHSFHGINSRCQALLRNRIFAPLSLMDHACISNLHSQFLCFCAMLQVEISFNNFHYASKESPCRALASTLLVHSQLSGHSTILAALNEIARTARRPDLLLFRTFAWAKQHRQYLYQPYRLKSLLCFRGHDPGLCCWFSDPKYSSW